MWSLFRALAAGIAWTQEQIETVERGGKATLIPHPLNSEIRIRVRPDPDWMQRRREAFEGTLADTRREQAGTIPIPHGQLVIADPDAPNGAVTVHVPAGEYEVVVTVAHEGAEETDDYTETVSHAFALLRDNKGVTTIEPLTDENGLELDLEEGRIVVFAGAGVMPRIAAEQPGLSFWTVPDLLRIVSPEANLLDAQSARVPSKDATGVLNSFNAGYGPGYGPQDYPLFRLADAEGDTVGVLVDFWVDNRPWDDLSDRNVIEASQLELAKKNGAGMAIPTAISAPVAPIAVPVLESACTPGAASLIPESRNRVIDPSKLTISEMIKQVPEGQAQTFERSITDPGEERYLKVSQNWDYFPERMEWLNYPSFTH